MGSPMHGELARPASPHEVGEGALTAGCPRCWKKPNVRRIKWIYVVVVAVVDRYLF